MDQMTIHIELAAPQTVNEQRAPWQSLRFLVYLHYLQANGADGGMLRLSELRKLFPDSANLRMCISRAFKDFAKWGIQVGWGEDCSRDPRMLNQDGRSQGPFWLAVGEHERMHCALAGQAASLPEIAEFLGIDHAAASQAGQVSGRGNFEFWLNLGAAQQALRTGRFLAPLQAAGNDHGALGGFKKAGSVARSHVQKSMAVLGEAGVWRRLDDMTTARRTLAKLRRTLTEVGPGESGYLDAMEQMLSAWGAYSQRDFVAARAILDGMRTHAARGMVLRYHPRVRFEWHNLSGLMAQAHALGRNADMRLERAQQAQLALEHFDKALQAAFELGSFDAAQQVAANTGLAIWLFDLQSLHVSERGARGEVVALRWLLFSEWLCRCAGGSGHSAWNAIYLMRIARANCPHEKSPPLAVFRRYQPITPQGILETACDGMSADLLSVLPRSWPELARELYAAFQQGAVRYRLLQRCGLLFEYAWFLAHAGDVQEAISALAQLRKEMKSLPPSDRAYFSDSLTLLPREVS
jgi:hypothetical protein